MDYTPICDCNGNTHANMCNAQTTVVTVSHVGECGGEVVVASIGDSRYEPVDGMLCTLPTPTVTIANGTTGDALTIPSTPLNPPNAFDGGANPSFGPTTTSGLGSVGPTFPKPPS